MGISRRGWIGGAAAAAALGAGAWLLGRPREDSLGTADDLDGFLDDFLRSEPEECLGVVVERIASGMPRDLVLAGLMVAPAISGGDASDVHAMAVMPSVRRMCEEAMTERERAVPLLWAAANAHAWSGRARDVSVLVPPAAPEDTLSAALARGDGPGAERAAAWLAEREGPEAAVATLALEAARERDDPHAAIWAAQSRRLLLDSRHHASAVVRSIARCVARRGGPPGGAARLVPDESDPITGAELARAIRSDPDVPLGGVRSKALFEALALLTVETRLVETSASGIGVHQMTLLDALFGIWATAGAEAKHTVLSTAVAWIVRLHRGNARGAPEASALTELAGDPLQLATEDPVRGYRAALGALARDEAAFLASVRARVAERVDDAHDLKHWCAVLDVADRLDGEVRARVLGSLALVWPVRARTRWSRFTEAEALAPRLR